MWEPGAGHGDVRVGGDGEGNEGTWGSWERHGPGQGWGCRGGQAGQERGAQPGQSPAGRAVGGGPVPSRPVGGGRQRGGGGGGGAAPGATRDAAELPLAMGGGCRAPAPPAAGLRLLLAHAVLLCAAGSAAGTGSGTRGGTAPGGREGDAGESVPVERRHPEQGTCGTGGARGPGPAGSSTGSPGEAGSAAGPGRGPAGPGGIALAAPGSSSLPVPSVSGAEGRQGGQGRLAGAPRPPPGSGCPQVSARHARLGAKAPGWNKLPPTASRRDHTQGPRETSLA